MAIKKVTWSYRAKIEFNDILEFYTARNKSPKYTLKLVDEVEYITNLLSKNELIGRLTSNKITRVIPLKTFLVFYEIKPNIITIVSFWDNRQDIQKRITK
jgi:toxin YoeB